MRTWRKHLADPQNGEYFFATAVLPTVHGRNCKFLIHELCDRKKSESQIRITCTTFS
jgi:hypothetical protein